MDCDDGAFVLYYPVSIIHDMNNERRIPLNDKYIFIHKEEYLRLRFPSADLNVGNELIKELAKSDSKNDNVKLDEHSKILANDNQSLNIIEKTIIDNIDKEKTDSICVSLNSIDNLEEAKNEDNHLKADKKIIKETTMSLWNKIIKKPNNDIKLSLNP